MYYRISKATSETKASLDHTTIDFMLELFEAIEYEEYQRALDHKESDDRRKLKEHEAKLKTFMGNKV